MKSFLFIFALLIACEPSVGFACDTCYKSGSQTGDRYFENNKHRQIYVQNLNGEERKRGILTNACFDMVKFAIIDSETRHCELELGHCSTEEGHCLPYNFPMFKGWTLDEVDAVANMDCFNAPDYERIEMMLEKYDGTFLNVFLPKTDVIVKQIIKGDDPRLVSHGIIDTSPEICYTPDSDGNNIWHAYAKTNAYMLDVANFCASRDVNETDVKFFVALLFDKNKDGETPMYIAFKNAQEKGFDYSMASNEIPVIKFVRDYIKSTRANCERVAQEVYGQSDKFKQNLGMSVNNIKNALGC